MNFESSPWTCRTTEFGVKCEVTGIMDTLLGNVKVGLVSLNENRLLPRGLFYFILLASPKTNKQTNRQIERTLTGTPQQLWPVTAGPLYHIKLT